MHPVLYLQQRHGFGMSLDETLHQGLSQAGLQGGNALHRRGQLTVVARQHHTADAAQGNPTGSLQCLGGLVDEQRAELLTVQQTVGRADQRRGNDTCLTKQLVVDAYLQFRGAALQALQSLVVLFVAALSVAAQVADGLSQRPQLRIVGVTLEAPLIGKREHLVVDAGWIAYS